jgi:hypothetical protein
MNTLALARSGRVDSALSLFTGMPAGSACPMATLTCHWYKRIKAGAGHPPGVLFMV